MSAETTFNEDIADLGALEDQLWPLCDKLAAKARRDGVAARVVVLKLRSQDFRIITRRRTLTHPTQTARGLFAQGREMLAAEAGGKPYRLIGIGMAELTEPADTPSDLFDSGDARVLKTERTIDTLRARFGPAAVTTGRTLKR